MRDSRHEIELIALAMFSVVPFYGTGAVAIPAVVLFHVLMLLLGFRALREQPASDLLMQLASVATGLYAMFFLIDAVAISRGLVRSSTHLLMFIAVYQTIEVAKRNNLVQRLLVIFVLFVTTVATSTHVSIILFVMSFGFMMFRQLMRFSHESTARSLGRPVVQLPAPRSRAALMFLVPTLLTAAVLFPALPRLHDPLIRGMSRGLATNTTGISDSINFSEARTISPDPQTIARVWMSREAVPFFTPLRLRGPVYDRYRRGEWRPGNPRGFRELSADGNQFSIARRVGFSRDAAIQQRIDQKGLLYLPVGTHVIADVPRVFGSPARGVYSVPGGRARIVNYRVAISREIRPLEPASAIGPVDFPITPEIATFARSIVPGDAPAREAAAKIESHLSTKFTYVPDPASLGRAITVEEFLLKERRGHCEYFAAGMVVLMTALGHPARIVGGFYGGEINPLTGYFVVRLRDAHAWVEVFNGTTWLTYDPTPASLRPGGAETIAAMYMNAVADSINYFWDRYILTFGLADQMAALLDLLDRARFAVRAVRHGARAVGASVVRVETLLILALFTALFVGARALRNRRRSIYARMLSQLKRLGIEISPSVTSAELLEYLERAHPDTALHVGRVVRAHQVERFSSRRLSREEQAEALRGLAALQR